MIICLNRNILHKCYDHKQGEWNCTSFYLMVLKTLINGIWLCSNSNIYQERKTDNVLADFSVKFMDTLPASLKHITNAIRNSKCM